MKVVVADSGPLIIIAATIGVGVLRDVIEDEVLVSSIVYKECTRDQSLMRAEEIYDAVREGLLTKCGGFDLSILPQNLPPALHDGEKSALALAMVRRVPILVDETLARDIASEMGLIVIGSIGILIKAKKLGLVENVTSVIKTWKTLGYRISDGLFKEAIRLAGEQDIPSPP